MLEVSDLHVAYGGLAALSGVSVQVRKGDLVSIVGPNGAGKTTLFKTISGVVPPVSGSIIFEGTDLLAAGPAQRAHLGIAHVPEGRQTFPNLSVIENLEMGAYTGTGRREWQRNSEFIFGLFPILAERKSQLAGTLSGGEQQMLSIGRGLASSPKLLMLDEPSLGFAPTMTDVIFESIAQIRKQTKLTILLVEQRVVEALQSCDRGYVLETGRVVLEGPHDKLLADDRVRQAYLGM